MYTFEQIVAHKDIEDEIIQEYKTIRISLVGGAKNNYELNRVSKELFLEKFPAMADVYRVARFGKKVDDTVVNGYIKERCLSIAGRIGPVAKETNIKGERAAARTAQTILPIGVNKPPDIAEKQHNSISPTDLMVGLFESKNDWAVGESFSFPPKLFSSYFGKTPGAYLHAFSSGGPLARKGWEFETNGHADYSHTVKIIKKPVDKKSEIDINELVSMITAQVIKELRG